MNRKLGLIAIAAVLIVAALAAFGWYASNGGSFAPARTAEPVADMAPLPPPDPPTSVRPLNPYPDAVRVELYAVEKRWDGKKRHIEREWVRPLTKEQRAAFESNLTIGYYEKGKAVVACCDPHHFLRYYNSTGELLGEVGICFCCGCVTTDVGGPLADNEYREFDYDKMKALIETLGVPTDISCH